jgi:hypothetical protein
VSDVLRDGACRARGTARVDLTVERPVPATSPRPSDPAVARAFATIDPTALPTSDGGVVNGEDPQAIPNRCQDVTGELCKLLQRIGIDACEVYLFVDHRLRRVDVSRAVEIWRWQADAGCTWGHVVLGVPGRPGANQRQIEGPRGAVELWDWTGRQFDWAVAVPHLVDLCDWGPYEQTRRPVCRRSAHRIDSAGFARCLLPDPLLVRFFGPSEPRLQQLLLAGQPARAGRAGDPPARSAPARRRHGPCAARSARSWPAPRGAHLLR